jgi:catechol 2,3-dioxygenase-like lactoylglutathione lyase family enzyme
LFSKIDTVHISVKDLERARNWYIAVLELEEIFHTGHYIVFKVGSGETPITIQEGEVRSSSTKTILFSDALEETRLKLFDRKVNVGEIQTEDGITYFEFKDLDGNQFEVCHFLST